MTSLLATKADVLRPLDDLLEDKGFWTEFETRIASEVVPLFYEVFVAGVIVGVQMAKTVKEKAFPAELPEPLSAQEIADLAERAILDYVPEFAKNISRTTYEGVRTAVINARSQGTGIEGVLRDIAPLFSRSRAELIGVTETTRLMGLGSQASYRLQGFNAWRWMAVNDPWVDQVCAGLAADSEAKPFPMDKLFSPAHPRCRCFPSPVIVEGVKPVSADVPYTPSKDELNRLGEEFRTTLSKKQANSVKQYTHGKGTGTINYLRDLARAIGEGKGRGTHWHPDPHVRPLDSAMVATPRTYRVYRGVTYGPKLPKLKVGDSYIDAGFVSTTTDVEIAEKFRDGWTSWGKGLDGDILEITVAKGTRHIPVGNYSPFMDEQEIILDRNVRLTITGRNSQTGHLQAVADYPREGKGGIWASIPTRSGEDVVF